VSFYQQEHLFRVVFWDILPSLTSLMMEAVRTSETSVDNHFTRQYIPKDNSEQEHLCSNIVLSCSIGNELQQTNNTYGHWKLEHTFVRY
jgi:hypothetical protein